MRATPGSIPALLVAAAPAANGYAARRRAGCYNPHMVEYDPLAPDTLADPFPAYAALRARCPVHHDTAFTPPFFTITRHDDVVDVLRDVEIWSSRYGPSPQYTRPSGLVNDPPEHTEFRRLFVRGFTPRTV